MHILSLINELWSLNEYVKLVRLSDLAYVKLIYSRVAARLVGVGDI